MTTKQTVTAEIEKLVDCATRRRLERGLAKAIAANQPGLADYYRLSLKALEMGAGKDGQ